MKIPTLSLRVDIGLAFCEIVKNSFRDNNCLYKQSQCIPCVCAQLFFLCSALYPLFCIKIVNRFYRRCSRKRVSVYILR